MKNAGIHYRICFLTVVCLIAAMVMGYGCRHTNFGALPPTLKTEPPDFGTHSTREFNASVASVGVHEVVIDFGEPVKDRTVEVLARDVDDTEIPVTVLWPEDYYTAHVKGAMPFCSELSITIPAGAETVAGGILNEDLELPFNTGGNPNDVDGTDSCTADLVVSHLFNETDGALLTGDMLLERPFSFDLLKQDIDTTEMFYIDYSGLYDRAGRMIRTPALAAAAIEEGERAGMAMLFLKEERNPNNVVVAKHYALDIWNAYDPVSDEPTSSILYDNTTVLSKNLDGPIYVGDLNGDGNADIMLAEESPVSGIKVIQYIYILKGPIAAGQGLLLMEEADPAGFVIGKINESITAPFFLGDVDGDGKDDFGAIHNLVANNNVAVNWDILIYHGNEDTKAIFNEILSDVDVISGDFSRKIVGLTSCDCNGDGISDIVVSDIETRVAASGPRDVRPHIGIFFGGRGFYLASMYQPNVELSVTNYENTYLSVSNFGDVDGDGFEDLGVLVEEENSYSRRITSSKIYVFMGREYWYEKYSLTSGLLPSANLIIDAKDANGLRRVDDLQMAGDIDNDGYYDIAIVTDDGIEKRVSVIWGSNGYRNMGWELDLDYDADVMWTFRNQ